MNIIFSELQKIRTELNLPEFELTPEFENIFSDDMPIDRQKMWETVIEVKKEIIKLIH